MKSDILTNGVLRALISLLIGLILLFFPGFVADSFVSIIGAVVVCAGIGSLIGYSRSKSGWLLSAGIFGILIGSILLLWPKFVLMYLFIVMAVLLLLLAIEEVVRLIRIRAGWPFFILPSLLVIAGIVTIAQPFESVKMMVSIFGVALVVFAISELIAAIRLRD